ncbi:MAG: hypothetical protein P4L83_04560 [Nevskia sp.]|nr:hypothetical protein [Nevskia sp.]
MKKILGLILAILASFQSSKAAFVTEAQETSVARFPTMAALVAQTTLDTVNEVTVDGTQGGRFRKNIADTTSGAVFTGSIAGTTLTITSISSGVLAIGQAVHNNGVAPNTWITAGSGSNWTINTSQTVSSGTMTSDNGGTIFVDPAGERWYRIYHGAEHSIWFGTTGNGTADDTAPLNAFIAALNSGNFTSAVIDPGTYLCRPLNAITATGVTISAYGATLLAKANSWLTAGDGSNQFTLGTNTDLLGLTLDGNVSAFTPATAVGRLLVWQSGDVLKDVTVKASPYQGARATNASGFTLYNVLFTRNYNVGFSCVACTHFQIFGGGATLNGTSAYFNRVFGGEIQFRSHDGVIVGATFAHNSADGLYLGQGTYAIRVQSSVASMNGDGGFTNNADNIDSSIPGNAECTRDIEYIDDEAYGNYSSGLTTTCTANNITVLGGRYYNNNRQAGDLAGVQSLYMNGIYMAGGTTGIHIDTKVYDDRQLCPIAAVSTSGSMAVLTATGWMAGRSTDYPRVGIYDSNMVFRGYGKIAAESSGSVTIQTTPYNGVTLGSIAPSDYVTQRVQHNGVFADNGDQGDVHADGHGHLSGPAGAGFSGYTVFSAYTNNGQNIRLPKAHKDTTQLLVNPSFDSDILNWAFSTPSGGSANHYTGSTKRSLGALQLVGGNSAASSGDSAVIKNAESYADSKFAHASCWAWAAAPAAASIDFFYGANPYTTTVAHPGGGIWKLLEISLFVPPGSTYFFLRVNAAPGQTAYFDDCDLHAEYLGEDNKGAAPPWTKHPSPVYGSQR